MRTILFATMIALLAACAARPPEPTQTVRAVKVNSGNIQRVIKGGYTIVDEKGRVLICRSEAKTGSHIEKTTSCMTEKEWDDLAEATARGVDRAKTSAPPPMGR